MTLLMSVDVRTSETFVPVKVVNVSVSKWYYDPNIQRAGFVYHKRCLLTLPGRHDTIGCLSTLTW